MTDVTSDFEFESIIFNSPLIENLVELRDSVSVIEIKEDIRYPFITADITLRDEQGFVSGVNITGGETITILIRSTRPDSTSISKRFYISKIRLTSKTGDSSETYIFELVEDILYESNLQNINRSYTGKCDEIISKIGINYLDKEVFKNVSAKQFVKLIVPNMTPLEAMLWIAGKSTTNDGYPFYLFSTLVNSKLNFMDLGTMINQSVINSDIPYRYWQSATNSEYIDIQRRVIRGFEQTNTEDLYSLIRRGLVGSSYEFIDTLKNKRNSFHFDLFKDVLLPLVEKNVLPSNQNNVMYGPNFKLNDKPFNEYSSRSITRIGGSSAFKVSDTEENLGLREQNSIAEYKHEVISRAMNDLLVKAPVTIVVNGLDFLDGDQHYTIGNNIRVEFLNSDPNLAAVEDKLDKRLSGNYLMYGAHHMFRRETNKYDLKLSCVKLANLSN